MILLKGLLKRLCGAWTCPNCGSINVEGAGKCWSCGYTKPKE